MPIKMQIIMFLFLMLGPFKIIVPFAKITRNADVKLTQRIAFRAILFSSMALLLAGLLGRRILSNYGIPVPILALAGGIIFFLVALLNVIQQFTPPDTHHEIETPDLSMAINPLAFPTIVTPYGIAALIVFLSISPDMNSQLMIGGIVVGIMTLNLIIMLITKYIYKILIVFFPILAAVLLVVQVALGLLIIYNQLQVLLKS
jgi:multiple antibiotic resistance protein